MLAVNPNADEVEGDACFHDLKSIPGGVDAVVIGTRPETAESIARECAELGIKRVWMHRTFGTGSASEAAAEYGRQHGHRRRLPECEVRETYEGEEGLFEHNQDVVEARKILFRDFAYDHRMTAYGEVSQQLIELANVYARGLGRFSFLRGLQRSRPSECEPLVAAGAAELSRTNAKTSRRCGAGLREERFLVDVQ